MCLGLHTLYPSRRLCLAFILARQCPLATPHVTMGSSVSYQTWASSWLPYRHRVFSRLRHRNLLDRARVLVHLLSMLVRSRFPAEGKVILSGTGCFFASSLRGFVSFNSAFLRGILTLLSLKTLLPGLIDDAGAATSISTKGFAFETSSTTAMSSASNPF